MQKVMVPLSSTNYICPLQELQSVRGQLATEQSRCFKLEVDTYNLFVDVQLMEYCLFCNEIRNSFSVKEDHNS